MKIMKVIRNFTISLLTFTFGVFAALAGIYYQTDFSGQNMPETAINETNFELIRENREQKPENVEAECLNAEYPKQKTMISACVVNINSIIPKPEYPFKARQQKIDGEVKASIVVDETGKVIWARLNTGHPLLQTAVKNVVCQAYFKPFTISGNPVSVPGLITYKFVLPDETVRSHQK